MLLNEQSSVVQGHFFTFFMDRLFTCFTNRICLGDTEHFKKFQLCGRHFSRTPTKYIANYFRKANFEYFAKLSLNDFTLPLQ